MDYLSRALTRVDTALAAARLHKNAAPLPQALGGTYSDSQSASKSFQHATECYEHNIGWVFACVRLIASCVAGQHLRVGRKVRRRSIDKFAAKAMKLPSEMKSLACNLEPLDYHPVLDLWDDPWPTITASNVLTTWVMNLELTGRGLLLLDERQGQKTIFPLPTSWVPEVDWNRNVWKIRTPGSSQNIPVPGERIINAYYADPADPQEARSPLKAMAGAIYADESITLAQTRAFSAGTYGTLAYYMRETPDGITPTLTNAQRAQLNHSHRARQGVGNSHMPLIVDGLFKEVKQLSLTPEEMGFLESHKIPKERILQGYGIAPILLGEAENSAYAAYLVAQEIFAQNRINPLLKTLSETLTGWLAPWYGDDIVLWLEEYVPHNADMAFKQFQFGLSKGAISDDEYRAYMGLPPLPKDDESQTTQDVQAAIMNGAQTQSLLSIALLVTQGQLTREAARGIIRAAFPSLPDSQIDGIVNHLERIVDNAGNQQGQQGNGSSDEPEGDDASEDDEEAKQVKAFVQALNPYTLKAYERN